MCQTGKVASGFASWLKGKSDDENGNDDVYDDVDDDDDENDMKGCWVNMVYSYPTLRSDSQWTQTATNLIHIIMIIIMILMIMMMRMDLLYSIDDNDDDDCYQAIFAGG